MSKRDYYEVLGVSKSADAAVLKKAYRKMAMKYHPDRNPDSATAEANFKEVKEAYEVLVDDQKRAAYDRYGHDGVNHAPGGDGFSGGSASFSDIFGDVFGDIFGGRGGPGQDHRGSDMRYTMELDLEQAVKGASVEIEIPTMTPCKPCSGTGAKSGTKPINCSTCGGAGQVRMQQGFFSVQQTCPTCRGAGQVIKEPCGFCRGQGKVRKNKTINVKIPAGVDTNDRVRLPGEGEPGMSGAGNGDLYVQILVRDHPIFTRDGRDLYCEVPISFADAALGGELEVPTLEGRVKLKIPVETQTGRLFRLRGKGVIPVRGGTQGDLLCKVLVETPVNLSKKQKELLREFQETIESDDRQQSPKRTSWFKGVKDFIDGMKI